MSDYKKQLAECKKGLVEYEKAWNEEHGKRIDAENDLKKVNEALYELNGRYQEVKSRVGNFVQDLNKTSERAEWLEAENTTLQAKVAHLEKLHEGLQQEAFWEAEMLLPFAEALELFPTLAELTSQPEATLSQWAEDVAEGLEALPVTFEQAHAERVKQCLLAQWVYVRWLELCHAQHLSQEVSP
jgi:chromosome segregation ATPase